MPVYVSTSCLAGGSNILDVLQAYAEAGLNDVELGSAHKYIDDISPAKFKPYAFNLIAHHYFPPPQRPIIINLASQNPAILGQSREHIKSSIEFCYSLGIKLFTFHAGFRADPDSGLRFPRGKAVAPYEIAFDTFVESVKEINSYALEKGIRVAIENNVLSEYNLVDGQNPFLLLCEADEFERLWERIPSDNVGMLLDLGHLKVTSHWLNFDRYEFINKVKDKIFAIHIHENNGRVDEHRVLDETSWCFEVINRKCFSNLPIVLEITKLSISQTIQQVGLAEKILDKKHAQVARDSC